MDHPALESPISIPFVSVADLTSDMIFDYIKKILQSNKNITFDEAFTFEILIIKLPSGNGRKSLESFIFNKKSILRISNKDNLCGYMASFLGKTIADNLSYKHLINPKNTILTREAIRLVNNLNLDEEKSCGLEEIVLIEQYYKDYQFFVINGDGLYEFIYDLYKNFPFATKQSF